MDEVIIDKIAARILALMHDEPIDPAARNVLMLFSGASTGFVVGMEAIRRLTGSQHSLTVVLTPAASQIVTEAQVRKAGATNIVGPAQWADAPGLVRQSDLVLIPTLSMNLAARLALGLMDSLISTLTIGALLAGKAVVAIKDGADPDGNAGLVFGAADGAAPALREKLAGHLATLASFGVELVGEGAFLVTLERRLLTGAIRQAPVKRASAPAKPPNGQLVVPQANGAHANFITATELLALRPGATVRLGAGSRLTPQAQDTARRLGLTLEFD